MNAELEGAPVLVSFALWLGPTIGYHTVLEWRSGQILGKYLVAIRVTSADGSPLTLRSSLARNVLRLVDWLPTFYLVAIVLLAVSERPRRLGDRVGNTVVVRS